MDEVALIDGAEDTTEIGENCGGRPAFYIRRFK